MKILFRQIEAWIWFTGDQPLAAGGFDSEAAKRLGKEFDFLEIGAAQRTDQQQVWVANRGAMKLPSPRGTQDRIKIHTARGVETDLGVEVDGTSDDAHAALNAVWKCLAGEGAVNVDTLGKIYDKTVMIVDLEEVSFDDLFPTAGIVRRFVADKMKAHDGGREPREPQYRMSMEFLADVGRRPIGRNVRIEPRVYSPSPHVFFTESPLRDDEHVAWLQEAVRAARRP